MPVIPFPIIPHLEIFGGIISSATVTDARGTRSDPDLVGHYRFYIDAIEADGCRIGLWDGASHDEAMQEAAALAPDFGPVFDLTGGLSS